ncbi:uncharacterized protein LOC130640854 [Hydractinia symbiolongicarpus]|uniref:uncharacterized protein LOC130640854 n=1 Tax=Hydractinia symbiolongicarpus TaxID=13093 RepID=UPI00254E9448|nr:uncharacterized protein LOC130640854 [Hydractinia symbiolongicarpus]
MEAKEHVSGSSITIQTTNKNELCVSHCKRKKYIQELSKNEQGVTLKKVKIPKNVILRRDVSIIEITLDFKKSSLALRYSTIREILFTKQEYKQVHNKATNQALSAITEQHTNKDEIPITFFDKNMDKIVEGNSYKITYCFISVYNSDGVLKTTVHTQNVETDDNDSQKITGKACFVNASTCQPTFFCSHGKTVVPDEDIDHGILSCWHCGTISCKEESTVARDDSFSFLETSSKKKRVLISPLPC